MKNNLQLILMIFFLVPHIFSAQVNQGGRPITFSQEYLNLFLSPNNVNGSAPTYSISTYNLPALNNITEQQRMDSIYPSSSNVGTIIPVNIDIRATASVQYLEDSSKIYLLKIASATANGLSFYFDNFQLPQGARLFFYNSDTSMFIGSFTSANNNSLNTFGTMPLNGDTIFIEYFEPQNISTMPQLHIYKIAHLYTPPYYTSANSSTEDRTAASLGNCEVDISCPDGANWQSQASSVALIYYYDDLGGFHMGSGAVINNLGEDGHPYFLTAYHLLSDAPTYHYNIPVIQADLATWVFVFNYYNCTCGDTNSSDNFKTNTGESGPQSCYGATMVTGDVNLNLTDYLLLDLTFGLVGNYTDIQAAATILINWSVCYSGWQNDIAGQGVAPFVCIHHPNGNKSLNSGQTKISTSPYGLGDATIPGSTGNTALVISWATDMNTGDPLQGITEAGSSGAPLYNTKQRIIGQLYGGNKTCNSPITNSTFGSFAVTWANDLVLSEALDPNNSNVSAMDTWCYTIGAGGAIFPPGTGGTPTGGTGTGTGGTGTGGINHGFPDQIFDINHDITPGDRMTICPGDVPTLYLHDDEVEYPSEVVTDIPTSEFLVSCSAPHDEVSYIWNWTCLPCKDCYSTKEFYYLDVADGCDVNFNNCVSHGDWHYWDLSASGGTRLADIGLEALSGVPMTAGHYYKVTLGVLNVNNGLNYYPFGWFQGIKYITIPEYDDNLTSQTLSGNYTAASHITMNHDNIPASSNVNAEAGIQVDIQTGTHISPGADFHAWISPGGPCYDGHRQSNPNDTTRKISTTTNSSSYTNVVTDISPPRKTDDFVPPGISKKSTTPSGFVYNYRLSPNPTNDKVSIVYNANDNDNISISVYSSLGVKIVSLVENIIYLKGQYKTDYDVTLLQDGMYYVEIKNNSETTTLKLNVIK